MSKVIGTDGKEYTGEFVDVQYDWMLIQGTNATNLTEKVRKQMESGYETIGNVVIIDGGESGLVYFQAMEQRQELFIDEVTEKEISVKSVVSED